MSEWRSLGETNLLDLPEDEAIAILGKKVFDELKKQAQTYMPLSGNLVCTKADYENSTVTFQWRGKE